MEKMTYLNRPNLEYIEELYQKFRNSPESVDLEWRMFFEGVEFAQNAPQNLNGDAALSGAISGSVSGKELDVYNLIRAYRDYGHFEARLNPLSDVPKSFPELSFHNFNLTEADLDQNFEIGRIVGRPKAQLRDIIAYLKAVYCGTLTVQVADAMPTVRDWFYREFESGNEKFQLTADDKKSILNQLMRAESFEKFIGTRYVGKKRFSIEGGDSLIPMLDTLVSRGVTLGVEEVVLGMAHRGRLNVLANFMGKAIEQIFAEFDGVRDEENSFFDGDVKYHLGFSIDRKTAQGPCHLSMAYNPSHLETVDPIVQGMVRAKQRRRRDTQERRKVIPVLIHGDAAFAGQGVVAETFQMSQLKGYTVGGTVHIVIDNQVGFTATPEETRSAPYSSDIAKMLHTPVLHVNGDDVEACVRAVDIAIRFRQEFKRDVVINVICYRRFGHNEGDEPAFTSPLMYDKIKIHPTAFAIYSQKLIDEGLITKAEADELFKKRIDQLQELLDSARKAPPKMTPMALDGNWKGLRRSAPEDFQKETNTKTKLSTLKKVGQLLTTFPPDFHPHAKIVKLVESRSKMLEGDGQVDWGMGELLCYGSLLEEGTPIRISGQDVVRGTFTHRHAGFYDIQNGQPYFPLKTIKPDEVEFCIYDSLLSEYAVLGFEYGNSSSDPRFLTIWEAQFGDFVNGAQIILDQFLSSGEQKWQRMSGLVLLLPHGYEGQGPEHSSARLERFLQLCAQDNMQVVNLTTPAQLFHALRRQVKRDFRKPLIVMSPKSLLRHPKVISTLNDLAEGSFQEVIPENLIDAQNVETVVLCSGKLYYDLLAGREALGSSQAEKTALIRVEQLYPFPEHKIVPALKAFKKLSKVIWAQEEPKNMGAWSYIQPKLTELMRKNGWQEPLIYAGRTERASPATGSEKVHQYEQAEIVQNCFSSTVVSMKQKLAKK
jgi:2-oxoglutarate dehydrogenase E1 component